MADAQYSQRQVTSFQTDEIQQLQRDVQRALDQTRQEMDAIRQQAEQNQHDVEVCARQQQEAADALQRAEDERENTGREREIGDMFSVRVTSTIGISGTKTRCSFLEGLRWATLWETCEKSNKGGTG